KLFKMVLARVIPLYVFSQVSSAIFHSLVMEPVLNACTAWRCVQLSVIRSVSRLISSSHKYSRYRSFSESVSSVSSEYQFSLEPSDSGFRSSLVQETKMEVM